MKAYQNLQVTGSIGVSGSVTAVYVFSTSSISSTASYVAPGATASYALSSSYLSGSSATVQNLVVAGTASIKYLNVDFESSSVIYSSGSNQFGDEFTDKHSFTGSVGITGSLTIGSGSAVTIENLTGSLQGTSSWAVNAVNGGSLTVVTASAPTATSLTSSAQGTTWFDTTTNTVYIQVGAPTGSMWSASSAVATSLPTGSVTASVDAISGFTVKSLT